MSQAPPALVLTAGLGTRLYPLTVTRAKPAAPVGGRPLVERILRWLAGHGVTDTVLNLHHHPESIAGRVGDGTSIGVRVRYSWEGPRVLGSAGGPRHALSLLNRSPFLIVNGDTLSDVRLPELVRQHHARGARVTLAVVPNREPDRYGGVRVDAGGAVTGFTRRGSPEPSWHFIGVQMADGDVFAVLEDGAVASSVGGLYGGLIAGAPGSVRAWCTDGEFLDIGTPADYLRAHVLLAAREGHRLDSQGEDCLIDATARLEACVLWDRVRVGAGATLSHCVVADEVRIPPGAEYGACALAPADRLDDGPLPPGARIEHGLVVVPLTG